MATRSVRRTISVFIAAFVAIVVFSACGGGSSGKSSLERTSTEKSSGTTTSAKDADQETVAAITGLTGFGATDAAWNANHQADDRFSPGSVYDPDPSLARNGDQRFNAKYFGVLHDGRVTSYEMRFPAQTSVKEAKRSILVSEFPADAEIAWFKRLDTCAQMLVRSKKVALITKSAALVEFSSGKGGDQYDPSDVWSAILMPIEPSDPGTDLGC